MLRAGGHYTAALVLLLLHSSPARPARATATPNQSTLRTLEPGVLKVAVTSGAPTNPYDPQTWIRRYVELFAKEHGLEISWVVVPFNESWLLASRDEVDVVATNVASFPDRKHSGATFSAPFLYEQRALRIRPADEGRYHHINDFAGKSIGVVRGMAAERDVRRRAPEGVIVHTAQTFEEVYAEFDAGRLDAIAEAEYLALDGSIIPSHGDDVILIDHHDLNPGQHEESVFVVRDESTNVLEAINAFIAKTPFPPRSVGVPENPARPRGTSNYDDADNVRIYYIDGKKHARASPWGRSSRR